MPRRADGGCRRVQPRRGDSRRCPRPRGPSLLAGSERRSVDPLYDWPMRVDIGGGTRLFFDSVGASLDPGADELRDKPVLLLLHGGPGSDHSVYRPWFDRFADTHHVVYLDHRGQGRSDERRDPTGWDLDTWADDIVRFCDAVDLHDPIVLGQSFGGFVAMHYAGRHPDHPGGLVLSSTSARHHVDAMLAMFERLGGAHARDVAARFWSGDATGEEMLRYDEVCTPLYNPG